MVWLKKLNEKYQISCHRKFFWAVDNRRHKTKAALTFVDKTSTIHEISTKQYKKLVNNTIMTSYKNTKSDKQPNKIHTLGQVIKRMLINGKQNCFTTLKDHNPNFLVNKTILVSNF